MALTTAAEGGNGKGGHNHYISIDIMVISWINVNSEFG
jgi:hypothetical protein